MWPTFPSCPVAEDHLLYFAERRGLWGLSLLHISRDSCSLVLPCSATNTLPQQSEAMSRTVTLHCKQPGLLLLIRLTLKTVVLRTEMCIWLLQERSRTKPYLNSCQWLVLVAWENSNPVHTEREVTVKSCSKREKERKPERTGAEMTPLFVPHNYITGRHYQQRCDR